MTPDILITTGTKMLSFKHTNNHKYISEAYHNMNDISKYCINIVMASTYVPHATHSKRSVSPTIGLVGKAFGKLLTISGSC